MRAAPAQGFPTACPAFCLILSEAISLRTCRGLETTLAVGGSFFFPLLFFLRRWNFVRFLPCIPLHGTVQGKNLPSVSASNARQRLR